MSKIKTVLRSPLVWKLLLAIAAASGVYTASPEVSNLITQVAPLLVGADQ